MSIAGTILSNLYTDFQKYVFTHSVLVNASGYAIGAMTKEVIQNLLVLLALPSLKWIGGRFTILKKTPALLAKVGWELMMFIMTVVFTYILLEYFFNRTILGMKTVVDSAKYDSYIKSKAEAKTDQLIPTSKHALQQAQKKNQAEQGAVDQTVLNASFAATSLTL